jgi:CheY-like chemotaxis protein
METHSSSVLVPPPSVLFVDDDALVRRVFARSFRGRFELHLAASAEEALEAIYARPFDVVVAVDLLPRMRGLTLLRRVSEVRPGAGRVIVTSTTPLTAPLVAACASGLVHAAVEKPWSRELLGQRLRSLVLRLRGHAEGGLSSSRKVASASTRRLPGVGKARS